MPLLSPTQPLTRDFLDIDSQRQSIFDKVKGAVETRYPMENELYSLELANVGYDKVKPYTLKDQKMAILDRRSLDVPLRGTWQLRNKANNQVISKMKRVVGRVPYMTQRGTFIYRGNEYTIANQQRLRAGIFARKKDNGELESHVNLLPGTGRSFRIFMEPETGVFKFRMG